MHTVAMVMNDMLVGASAGEASDRTKPAGREGEGPRQRFADMLPLSAGEGEARPDNNDVEQVSKANDPGNPQATVDADKPKGRSARGDEKTPAVGIDPAGRDVPVLAVPKPDVAGVDGGKKTLSGTVQSQVPHHRTSMSSRASNEPQVTSRKDVSVSKDGANVAPGTAGRAKGPGYAPELVTVTGTLARPGFPKTPGRVAADPTVPGVGRGTETTATPAARKGDFDGIAGPQVQIAGSKDAVLNAPAPGNATKEASPRGLRDGLMVRPEAGPTSASEMVTSLSRSSIPAQVGTNNAAAGGPSRDIGEQILDSLHASLARGDRQITIRLRPPELGTVLVRFREDGEHITGLFEVGKSDIRREIEQALPQVLRALHDAGVQVRRFEVVTSDQGQRDFARDQMHQGTWSQQHGSGENPNPLSGSGQTWRSQDDTSRPAYFEEEPDTHHPGVATPGRINMLL